MFEDIKINTEVRNTYSFSSGPAMLPIAVLNRAKAELMNWNNIGIGIMEMSHRSKEFA